ncbi:hypothetical protein LPJ53_005872 [Coemansia erecta]|uniref:Elongation factor 1-gamma n=1 Tax=Coemansia erecta TaxID=147472 RepID=A0A9W8CPB5_9FUNG|nr:hypothetical protein LPJ53_005872 [Coemansia erecta]
MAPIGKLIGPTANFRNYKARIVAKHLGVDIETTPQFKLGIDNKTPEYLVKYPVGKVPAFESADGFSLTDSSVIAYYIASKGGNNSSLLGQTPEETAEILQFIMFAESDFTPAALGTFSPLLGSMPMIKPAHQQAEQQLDRFLDALNTLVVDRTFLVGERLTIADVVVTCDLIMSYKFYLEEAGRTQYHNLTRYFKAMVAQPAFKAVLGDVELCKERLKPAAPAVDETEEEAAPAANPKSKLDLLPKPKMIFDEWKRFYLNNTAKPDAMNWLWKHFDDEGYSFWKVEYKYNNELTSCFMTNNLVAGVCNRLERAQKYAFGCLLTLGKDNDNMIWGYFIVRGLEVPEEIIESADYESFDWSPADYKDPKTRAEIEDCFAGEGPALPRECNGGRIFK